VGRVDREGVCGSGERGLEGLVKGMRFAEGRVREALEGVGAA
jgi:hypothetical protein